MFLDILSWILILSGGLFGIISAIGVLRMPDNITTAKRLRSLTMPKAAAAIKSSIIISMKASMVHLLSVISFSIFFCVYPHGVLV